VRQHPAFGEFRVERGWWGWAQKAPARAGLGRGLKRLMGG